MIYIVKVKNKGKAPDGLENDKRKEKESFRDFIF